MFNGEEETSQLPCENEDSDTEWFDAEGSYEFECPPNEHNPSVNAEEAARLEGLDKFTGNSVIPEDNSSNCSNPLFDMKNDSPLEVEPETAKDMGAHVKIPNVSDSQKKENGEVETKKSRKDEKVANKNEKQVSTQEDDQSSNQESEDHEFNEIMNLLVKLKGANVPKKHSNTKLRDYSGMTIPEGAVVRDWKTSPLQVDGRIYVSNYACLSEKEMKMNYNYFILDGYRLEAFKKVTGQTISGENFMTLSDFTCSTGNEQFTIRTFASVTEKDGDDETYYVFLDDALQTISLSLQMQQQEQTKLIEVLHLLVAPRAADNHFSKTITLAQFKSLLGALDIDKGNITIVPDLIYEHTSKATTVEFFNPINTLNPKGTEVMSGSQAMLYTLQSVICGINWTSVAILNSTAAVDEFKKPFFEIMDHYAEMNRTFMVLKKLVDKNIADLKKHRLYVSIKKTNQNYLWANYDVYKKMQYNDYQKNIHEFQLPNYIGRVRKVPVWEGRVHFVLGWISSFYHQKMGTHKEFLMKALAHKIPNEMRKHQGKLLQKIVDSWTPGNELEIDRKSLKEVEMKVEVKAKMSEDVAPQKPKKDEETPKKPKIQENLQELQEAAVEAPPAPEASKTPKNPPKRVDCDKCFRTMTHCKEAQEAQKAAEKKAEQYEKKAKRTEKLEGDVKKMKKEMEEFKEKEEKSSEENEKLKKELLECQERMKKMEVDNSKFQARLEEKKQNNERMELEMGFLKKVIDDTVLESTLRQNHLEEDLGRRDRTILQLRETLSSRLANNNGTSDSDEPSTSSSDTDNWEEMLLAFKTIKENFPRDELIAEAKIMADKLMEVSKKPEIKQLAEYEMFRLKASIRIYLESIEINLFKIEKTHDTSDLVSLPPCPRLSSKFLTEYCQEMDKQPPPTTEAPMVPETGIDPKTHCYICHDELSGKLYNCKGCNQKTHAGCSARWLLYGKTCGYCRREMLPPKTGAKN
ncbi:hypothetical protein GCK72_010978 [Caenorhabditis remanei]|uniref:RING-type domain-containing protein n=1 Tax=Caenorhabditis remanei TaxID=31234 RepID=A0A6A5H776_CAERE|nr:hypothetical protein GCK72_010978 [Caenorhabditis remanei]KAF1762716.1 hypothetical protein GCK72_010978 [Caenorhabditis remanei]